VVEGLKPPVRWLSSYWDEEDILFYFEADEDGVVLRQVELQGPTRTPIGAASLAELPDARSYGSDAVVEYETTFGALAEHPISEWDPGFPHEDISADEFEAVWMQARRERGRARDIREPSRTRLPLRFAAWRFGSPCTVLHRNGTIRPGAQIVLRPMLARYSTSPRTSSRSRRIRFRSVARSA
jgi:hypothetical protein